MIFSSNITAIHEIYIKVTERYNNKGTFIDNCKLDRTSYFEQVH